ncbi:HD domain-containing protein [Streptomyces sp. NPDC047017]|uniref:HD-GYP domain-containing protein n=1 Tax=Streptomyces sp. NPDC047017 TaxID=3155024 RepID=UPI0033FAC1CB
MRRPDPTALIRGCAALAGLVSLAVTARTGLRDPGTALAFGALILFGELTRWSVTDTATGTGARAGYRSGFGTEYGSGFGAGYGSGTGAGAAAPGTGLGLGLGLGPGPGTGEAAPLGAAGALSYALLGEVAGLPSHHGVCQVVAVVLAACLLGSVPHIARGRGPTRDHLARRVLTVLFAAVCFQPLYNRGVFRAWDGPAHALLLLALLVLTALCGAVLAAAPAHSRTRWPFGPLLREELRGLLGIGPAVCATGAVMALAVAAVGLWALPVLAVPLLLAQLSLRRYAAVRATYRQTIASLARATEVAGYTPAGHARRVAALSRAVGRDLGLREPELTVLEHAALMHDIGQLSLVDPVPAGATSGLPAAEQRRIALLGGAVVRQTGVDREVAVVVERQADPCPEQPLPARIVRAVNAYEEKARDAGPGGGLRALEELRLAGAGHYAPDVVEALARVLSRDCLTPPVPG